METQPVSFLSINCSLFWLSLSLSPTLLLTTRFLSGVCVCVCNTRFQSCQFFLRSEEGIYVLQTLMCCTLWVRPNSRHRLGQKVFSPWPSAKRWKKVALRTMIVRAEETENGCDCRNNQHGDCDSSPANTRGQTDVLFFRAELSDATGNPEGFQFSWIEV